MGAIQNSINSMIGTIGSAAAIGSYLKEQDTKRAEEVAVAENALKSNLSQYKFDTIEAAAAIKAHEPEFAEQIKDYDLKNLKDEQVQELADKVEAFRTGKMTADRVERIEKAAEAYNKGIKPNEISTEFDKAGKESYRDTTNGQFISKQTKEYADQRKTELDHAYDAERELNQRLEASRTLKFNIEKAKATIKERGGKL